MPIYVDVIARLDERAAATAANRVEKQFAQAGKNAGNAMEQALNAELSRSNTAVNQMGSKLSQGFTSHGRLAGRGFGTAFGSELAQSLPGVSGFSSAMRGYDSAAGKVGAVAGRALGLAFTTAAAGIIGAAGYTLFKGFERYKTIDAAKNRLENLNRTLAQTGRATLDVGRVMDTVNGVVEGTRFSLSDAFSVSTRALSSPTGDLKRFMTVVADAAQFTGQSLEDVGTAFINIANSGSVGMEEMNNQLRGIPLEWLAEQVGVTGAELQKMFRENKVGLEDLMQAVERNANGFAKGGVATIEGSIEQLQTAVARLGANFLGALFGQPTDDANGLAESINAISDRLNDVNKWVTAHQDDIKQAFDTAVEVVGNLLKVLGNVGDWFVENKSVAAALGTVIGTAFAASKLSGFISGLQTINTLLGGSAASGAAGAAGSGIMGKVAALSAANVAIPTLAGNQIANQIEGEDRPWWWAIQRGFTAPGRIWDKAFGSDEAPSPGGSTAGLQTLPGFNFGPRAQMPAIPGRGLHWEDGKGWVPDTPGGGPGPAGSPIQPPPGLAGDASTGGKGPTIPVVPYTGDPMSLLQGYPATSSLYGAAESVLKAQHDRAQAESDLNALIASNEATAEQIQDARNKLVQADSDILQAELRLQEAKQSATEKYAKTLDRAVSDLGEIGAQLDKDFGISKGLAGIAENLTKFLANLAAAPVLGALTAVREGLGGTQGGGGIIGMAGALGAFGPQFTGIDYSAGASAMGPMALQPGAGGVGIDQVDALAAQFGLTKTSGLRPGDPGYHGKGLAGDYSGPPGQMRAFAEYMAANFGMSLRELIHDSPGFGTNINDGKSVGAFGNFYTEGQAGEHRSHVHVATGMPYASNNVSASSAGSYSQFGRPNSKQATANMIYQQAVARGYSPHEATSIVAYAIGESGLNAGISGGAQGGAGAANEVIGLFQQKPAFAQGGGISPSQRSDPAANTYAYLNQLEKNRHLPIEQALPATSVGGPLASGAGAQPQNWANLYGQAQNLLGGAGGGGWGGPTGGVAYPGIGMPQGLPFGQSPALPGLTAPGGMGVGAGLGQGIGAQPGVGGAATGPTIIGGVGWPNGSAGGGNAGSGGGLLGGAASMAAGAGGMALDAMAPGAGTAASIAANIAIQEINRAIQFGGELAGIGVQGLMETFLPVGASEMAANSWITRIAGGIAGMAPQLPNIAGGKGAKGLTEQQQAAALQNAPGPLTPEQVAGQHGQGASPGPGNQTTNNITVNNQRATEDGTGRDIAWHQTNMHAGTMS